MDQGNPLMKIVSRKRIGFHCLTKHSGGDSVAVLNSFSIDIFHQLKLLLENYRIFLSYENLNFITKKKN
jgi:hypothetical protein